MSLAPATTPFLTTDQNGSLAWPWLTTMMWIFSAAVAGAAKAAAATNVAAAAMVVLIKRFMRLPPSWATLPRARREAGNLGAASRLEPLNGDRRDGSRPPRTADENCHADALEAARRAADARIKAFAAGSALKRGRPTARR